MAEHPPAGPAELGAPMDYEQHEHTYAGFLNVTKVGILGTVATLQALTLFGLANNGFWLGVLMLLLMSVASVISFVSGSMKTLVGVVIIGFLLMALTLG